MLQALALVLSLPAAPTIVPTSTPEKPSCCKKGDRPQAVRVLEHGLPPAAQTHEVIFDPVTNSVLVTQMEEGRLLRFHIDDITGELDNPCESTVLDVPHRDKEGKPFIGLHGLSLSDKFPGHAWATLQYVNLIVLVDIKTLAIKSSFPCPQTLADGETTIGGPHSVCEKKGHIYVTMKGGATCHGPPEESENGVEEATAHGVWRVAINDEGGVVDDGYVFMVAATPPMCAVDEQGDCWVVADAHPTVACIPFNAKSSADDLTGSGDSLGIEVDITDEDLRAKVKPVFEAADLDGSGLLNYVEMVSLCSSLDVGLSTDELTKLIRESDADGDGEISFDEFIAALRAHIGGSQKQQTTAGGLGAIFAAKSASSLPGAKSWWLPYQYAVACHGGGPGIVIGPDGQPWFCILTGVGLIGTIDKGGHIKVFELFNSGEWNTSPRICHLQWGTDTVIGPNGSKRSIPVLYCISSDLIDKSAVNTLIRVRFDETLSQVIAQHEIAMPTQATCCHRIALVNHPTHESLLVTELTKSQLLQVFTETLPELNKFPMKQMKLVTHRVYDALGECPRAGTPLCMCEGLMNGGAVPVEDPFGMPSLHGLMKMVGARPNFVDPRTGELKFEIPSGFEVVPSAFTTDYPSRGFKKADVPAVELYEKNGLEGPMPDEPSERPKRVGASPAQKHYREGYIKAVLRREPWRRAMLTEDMRQAGVTDADLAEWDWGLAGQFADSNHPDEPPRVISVDDTSVTINGKDADGTPWTVAATLDTQTGVLVADFTIKGGPIVKGQVATALPAAYSPGTLPGIMWEDGNVWEKVG